MIKNAMGKVYRLFVLFLSCFMFLAAGAAQEKIVEGGKTFYLHKVHKGEGFYRLSVIYDVAQKEIIDANPDLALQGLKEGSLVKIPVKAPVTVQKNNPQEGFIFHTVKKGETLYAIAREYGVAVNKIIELNPGVDQQLAEGSVVKLPANSPKTEPSSNGNHSNDRFVVHTVAAGETLFRIAQQYQISLSDLLSANPVLNESALSVGEKIRIPRKVDGDLADGGDSLFLIHRVAAGETLFGISQKYGRSQVEIKLVNEDLAKGELSEGQKLRIPRQPLDLMLDKKALFLTHSVSRKETLYGVGRNYNVDIEVIRLVNPNLDFASLKKGVEILIPRASWYKEIAKGKVGDQLVQSGVQPDPSPAPAAPCVGIDKASSSPLINVAMLMPFDYAGYQLIKHTPDSLRSEVHRSIASRSKNFVEFYEGALIALDSLKRAGVSVNLFVYDTRRDSVNFSKLLQREELEKVNLIIGPANIDHMKTVAAFAKEKQIPVVFPFATMDGTIRSNPYVYQASPIDSLYRRAAVDAQLKFAANKRVIVLTTGGTHPFELAVINQIKQQTQNNGSHTDVVFHRYVQREVSLIKQLVAADKETVIIIPNIEEVKVSRMLTNLGLLAERSKMAVTVLGYSDWLKFQTIEPEDLHKLNATIFSSYGADYSSETCRSFSRAYRRWFHSEPVSFNPYFQQLGSTLGYSRFGMWGYDVTFYFVGAINTYGSQFQKCLADYQPKLVQSNFRFTHLTNWGGASNTGLITIHFTRDFQTQVSPVK